MNKDIKNLPASVRERLKNNAEKTNRAFSEVLQFYGMERFLYRFSCSKYADKFVLKGALMFTVWQVPDRRTTLDIDFLARYDNQMAGIIKLIKNVCVERVTADGLIFDPKTVIGRRRNENVDYEGVRIKLIGF